MRFLVPSHILKPLLSALLALSSGCGFSIERVKPPVTVTRDVIRYESPQDCYEEMTAAASRHDFEAALDCMTLETQQQLGGLLLYSGHVNRVAADNAMFSGDSRASDMQTAVEGVNQVFADHEINEQTLRDLPPFTQETLSNGAAMQKLGKRIDDLHSFTSAMLALLAKLNPGAAPMSVLDGELTMNKIEDDNPDLASGTIVAKRESQPVEFQRVEGGWQIVLEMGSMSQKRTPSKSTKSPKSTSPGAGR